MPPPPPSPITITCPAGTHENRSNALPWSGDTLTFASAERLPDYAENSVCYHAWECPNPFRTAGIDFKNCCDQCGEEVQVSACNYTE